MDEFLFNDSVAVFDGKKVEWFSIHAGMPYEDGRSWAIELTISRFGLVKRRLLSTTRMGVCLLLPKLFLQMFSNLLPGCSIHVGPPCPDDQCIFRDPFDAFGLGGLMIDPEE